MTVDFKAEVEKRKEEILADLKTLLSIPSVREDELATEDAPFGPGPKAALLKFLEIGERDGFVTKNIDNYAGHMEFGSEGETLGIFGHVDVVPVDGEWETDPFTPVIKDNRIYARGSSDDKGPMVAAYHAMKIIRDLELPITKQIRFIIGTDEESSWKCMDRYLEVEPKPDFGFSPDAEFPIINGEKGNATLNLKFPATTVDAEYQLVKFTSGMRANMVPAKAIAEIKVSDVLKQTNLTAEFGKFTANNPISGEIDIEDEYMVLTVHGKASHGASPAAGVNAATYLATFLNEFEFKGTAKIYLATIANLLHDSTDGTKLGVAISDDVMGELTMNCGVFRYETDTKTSHVVLNFRYPKGTTEDMIAKEVAGKIDATILVEVEEGGKGPHYVPEDDKLVVELLAAYEAHTGLKGHGQVIGGGTFGRLLERGVAYGAMFPDSIDTMHQANEFMSLDDLFNATVIYADAIYRLIK